MALTLSRGCRQIPDWDGHPGVVTAAELSTTAQRTGVEGYVLHRFALYKIRASNHDPESVGKMPPSWGDQDRGEKVWFP
ncbi:MAG: hypothetical protein CVU63_05015 [Deltaproteobacteria bacterium HGW-Deltaproteobacteria-20]|jgi:hypothetical protein|nr:MAG: hypothetical protein CVU63_05015 [Deltaproteobacteria bacterium HGW-Deltaproteobacteria-20]